MITDSTPTGIGIRITNVRVVHRDERGGEVVTYNAEVIYGDSQKQRRKSAAPEQRRLRRKQPDVTAAESRRLGYIVVDQ